MAGGRRLGRGLGAFLDFDRERGDAGGAQEPSVLRLSSAEKTPAAPAVPASAPTVASRSAPAPGPKFAATLFASTPAFRPAPVAPPVAPAPDPAPPAAAHDPGLVDDDVVPGLSFPDVDLDG